MHGSNGSVPMPLRSSKLAPEWFLPVVSVAASRTDWSTFERFSFQTPRIGVTTGWIRHHSLIHNRHARVADAEQDDLNVYLPSSGGMCRQYANLLHKSAKITREDPARIPVVSQSAGDSRLATLIGPQRGQIQHGSLASTPEDELESLCEQGQLDRAFDMLQGMDHKGATSLVPRYRCLLKACTKRKALTQARRVHAHLVQNGLESTGFLGESVVKTFVKCGSLNDALHVFHRLPMRTVVSWTAIISGSTQNGHCHEALRMYQQMQEEGVEPSSYTFVSLLKACGSLRSLDEGKRIHAEAVKHGCEDDLFVRTCLVDMYGKCDSPVDARHVFDGLSHKDVVSWNAMLASYAQQGLGDEALHMYTQMQQEGVSPTDRTFVSALQACCMVAEREVHVALDGRFTKVESLAIAKAIHADARKHIYNSDVFVGSTLIGLYGKCGSIVDALGVFDGLSQKNVVTWSVMLAAYVEQGEEDNALQLYRQMQQDGVSPDARTLVTAIQACGMLAEKDIVVVIDGQSTKARSLAKGKVLHADAWRRGYDSDVFVANTLMSLYGKCGSIVDTDNVFDGLYQQSVVSCNTMLTAYVQQAQADKALQLYEKMQEEGLVPSSRTFVSALQACGMIADKEDPTVVNGRPTKLISLNKGMAIHADVCRKGYALDVYVGCALVSMYGKCGRIVDAENVFGGFFHHDVVSWTAMLTVYVEHGQAQKALQLYEQMQEEGVSQNERTVVTALQACSILPEEEKDVIVDGKFTKVRSLAKGKAMHADALRIGCDSDVFVGNTLVSMYGKCGSIEDAEHVFNMLSKQDVVSWNAMLMACVEQGEADKAMHLYIQMQQEDVSPDARSFVCALQACSIIAGREFDAPGDGESTKTKSLQRGKALHAEILRKDFSMDVFVGSTLLCMYEECGSISDAQSVFDRLQERDVVTWTAMLAAYVQEGQAEKGLHIYIQTVQDSVSPDAQTFVWAVQACCILAEEEAPVILDGVSTKVKSLKIGKAIHAGICERGYQKDVFVASTLISMYGKAGSIKDAQSVFDGLSQRDVVSWTVLLTAHVDQGQGEMALKLYEQMRKEDVSPDDITLVCILQACSNSGSLSVLKQIHAALISSGSHLSPIVANTLISAYGRCSSIIDAQTVFYSLPQPDLVSWTAIIAAFARQGDCMLSLELYEEMQLAGVKPDGVTFLSLLCACSHAGLVDRGVQYFESMARDYGITPSVDHYVSMVDLLGRAGHFTRLEELMSTMPMQPNISTWLCLLASCMKHHQVVLGRQAFDNAVHLQPKNAAIYLLMWNIYAHAGLWDCAQEVTRLRQNAGAWKNPGQTWIEHQQAVHAFVAGDCKHPQEKLLNSMLEELNSVEHH